MVGNPCNVHDNENWIIAELNATGTTIREYVWLGDLPIAVLDGSTNTANPSLFFVHADHLNRPIAMSNASRDWVWRAQYEPFGAVYSIAGPAANDNRFPGQMFQLEAGLAYNWHRHYDASLGRYTQPDPLGLTAMLSDGPSVYGYAWQSPLMWVDPTGLEGSFFSQVGRSITDFGRNYRNMRDANTIGADKYFHCMANCQASQRGRYGQKSAQLISDMREVINVCKGGKIKDSEADQYANFVGRIHGSMSGKACTTLCGPFRPRGLPERF